MPIDPETQAVIDGLKAMLAPEALSKALAPLVEAHVKAATKDIPTSEALAKLIGDSVAKLKPADDADPEAGKSGKDKPDPKVAALERKLAEMETQNKAALQAAADEKGRSRIAALHTAARDALAKAGIPAERIPAAMALVKDMGVLDYDGDRPGWKGKDSLGLDAVLDIAAAAKSFVGTPDGKLFMPPAEQRGTGDRANDRSHQNGAGGAHRNADGSINIASLGRAALAGV